MKTSHILASVCVALGGLVWLDNSGGSDNAPALPRAAAPAVAAPPSAGEAKRIAPPAGAPGAVRAIAGNPLAAIENVSLGDTVNRPLFAPSRSRPPVVVAAREEAPPPPPPPPPPSYALLGVVSNGGHAIALLKRATDGTSFRVETGDILGGWRVAEVGSQSVRLEREDGTSRTVHLRDEQKDQHSAETGTQTSARANDPFSP